MEKQRNLESWARVLKIYLLALLFPASCSKSGLRFYTRNHTYQGAKFSNHNQQTQRTQRQLKVTVVESGSLTIFCRCHCNFIAILFVS